MRAWAWLAALAVCIIVGVVGGVDTADKDFATPMRFYHNGRYVNGDSGDVVRAYPSEEDTTGNGMDLTWIGGSFSAWSFEPDSSEVWDFYVNDTLLTLFSNRYYQGPTVFEGAITSARAFAPGVVDSAALSDDAALKSLRASSVGGAVSITGPDSTIRLVSADTVEGNWVRAKAFLSVGQTLTASDGDLDVEGTVTADSVNTRSIRATGNTWLGQGMGDTHFVIGSWVQGSGTVEMGDATFNDGIDVAGSGSIAESLVVGGRTHLENMRVMDPSSVLCDSFDTSGGVDTWVTVTGVSEMQDAGYKVRCSVWPNFGLYAMENTIGGSTYNRMLFAAPKYQYPDGSSDSVYVVLSNTTTGSYFPFCVECIGVK